MRRMCIEDCVGGEKKGSHYASVVRRQPNQPPITTMVESEMVVDWGSRIDEILEVPQPQTHSDEAFRIKKGDSLFGFNCIHIYTEADWYHAFPLRGLEHGILSYFWNNQSDIAYRKQIISKDAQIRKGCDGLDRERILESSDVSLGPCFLRMANTSTKVTGVRPFYRQLKTSPLQRCVQIICANGPHLYILATIPVKSLPYSSLPSLSLQVSMMGFIF